MGYWLSVAALDLLGCVEDAYPGTTVEHIPIDDGMIHTDEWRSDYWPPVSVALLPPQFFNADRVQHLYGDTLVLDRRFCQSRSDRDERLSDDGLRQFRHDPARLRRDLDTMIVGPMGVGKKFPSPVQDTLNFLLEGRVKFGGPEWNIQIMNYMTSKSEMRSGTRCTET